jgi:hypothetical protein
VTGDTQALEYRLASLGLTLAEAPPPVAVFQPWVRSGSSVYVSGQVAVGDGQLVASGGPGLGAATPRHAGRGPGHRRARPLTEGSIG